MSFCSTVAKDENHTKRILCFVYGRVESVPRMACVLTAGPKRAKRLRFWTKTKTAKKERKDGIAFGLPGWQQTFHL